MITIAMDPIIVRLGSIALTWHGLLAALGVAVGFVIILREAQRVGFKADDVYTAAILAIPAGFIGARLFHVADNWSVYQANPWLLLSFQEAGLAIYGAFAGGLVAILGYVLYKRVSVWLALDTTALAILVGDAVGRLGCLINGDSYGQPTTWPWGVVYTHPASFVPREWLGVPTHPFPLYEIVLCLATAAVLYFLRPRIKVAGVLFLLSMGSYALGRFFTSLVRDNLIVLQIVKTETVDIGLNEAQVISVLALLVIAPLVIYRWRRGAPAPAPASQPPDDGRSTGNE